MKYEVRETFDQWKRVFNDLIFTAANSRDCRFAGDTVSVFFRICETANAVNAVGKSGKIYFGNANFKKILLIIFSIVLHERSISTC